MDHREVVMLITDHVWGRLSPSLAAEVEAHLAACAECLQVAQAIRGVRAEAAAHGGALFEPHPRADELAGYALSSQSLETETLARIGAHVRACPTCARELELARQSVHSSWARAPMAWLRAESAVGPALLLRPALAVLAVLLCYPAYLGIVKYPEARRAGERAATETEDLRRRELDLRHALKVGDRQREELSGWGGGVQALILSGIKRGAAAGPPAVHVRAGQPSLPILIDYVPPRLGPSAAPTEVEIAILQEPADSIAWSYRAPLSEVWEPASQTLSLLVPTRSLPAGAYRLEVRTAGETAPPFVARFAVLAGPTP